MMRPTLLLLTIALHTAAHSLAHGQTPPKTKGAVPPPGIAIPDADREALTKGVEELAAEIQKIPHRSGTAGSAEGLLPDVEIFLKAVDWPLKYNEFYDVKQVASAKALLAEGMARAKALQSGKSPWASATGPVVRGFR